MKKGDFFGEIPQDLSRELVQTIVEGDSVRVDRIVSIGQASPEGFWYEQEQREFVLVLQGAARIDFEDGEALDLNPGMWTDIPAYRRHRVGWTSPEEVTVWLAVHY
ncbi:MAG: hypothetical protein CL897_03195 [Dehalococcoidia bacterium]|nr:hypothetical protein [Dehalococcoidia bacterium]HCV00839.1 hypothetical protein [Dehalococcoidia bacterium]|tara:strand:- start:629 stop:946 length:318 start_codon:yes stop_codon:yes gene_type:complete